jgi:uncharacterized protein YoxC
MLAVQGVDALRAPYREEVTTGALSCHGCNYQTKREVHPGDIVFLNAGDGPKGASEFTNRARVKSIQKLDNHKAQTYNVGVELEIAGNIWGIPSPPDDWFAKQSVKAIDSATHGRELRVIARTEPQRVPVRIEGNSPVTPLKKSEAAAAPPPWFSDLMAGLSNQIRVTVTQIAAVTLAGEKDRLLDEFRVQLQNEAAGTIEHMIATSKDEVAQRALKVLNEGAEAALRTSHESLVGAIERDIEDANQRMTTLGDGLSQRINSMVTGTVEQLQLTLEATRTEAAERFVVRLREKVAPVLEEAKSNLQELVVSQSVFKEESQAIYRRVTNQLESDANARLQTTHEELETNSASIVNECNEKLRELSQTFAKIAQDSARTMLASATDDAKKKVEDRASEISAYFTGQLEGHIRNYLEFIGESMAEFQKKTSAS